MTYTYLAHLKDGQKPFNIEVMEDRCLNLKEIGHVLLADLQRGI